MSAKILGVSAGRANSNCDILLKEALLACQAEGADVTMINLRDYNIIECTGCTSCTIGMSQGKNNGCVLDEKDDKKKIMEVLLESDGVIFAAPTYELVACSVFAAFAQRSLSYETSFLETIGAIEHRDRVCALIAVGGSTRSWQSMALESMQAAMFTTDLNVVDMFLATRVPAPAQCLLHDEMLERVAKVGKNVMTAIHTPVEERRWLGDENMGWCPNCHSNALILGEVQWDGLHYPVECQVCGSGGNLERTEDGKWKFVIQENGLIRDRTTVKGRAEHLKEIAHTQGGYFQDPEKRRMVKEKLEKYKDLKFKTI
jgi:multimeric flavodoxin WrbA